MRLFDILWMYILKAHSPLVMRFDKTNTLSFLFSRYDIKCGDFDNSPPKVSHDKHKRQSTILPGLILWNVTAGFPHKGPVTRKYFHLKTSSYNVHYSIIWLNAQRKWLRSVNVYGMCVRYIFFLLCGTVVHSRDFILQTKIYVSVCNLDQKYASRHFYGSEL